MLEAGRLVGVLSRVVVCAAVLRSFALLDPPVPPPVDSRTEAATDPRRWSVSVDGWTIEVDGVRAARPDFQGYGRAEESYSPFDALILGHAEAVGLDWRLISALIYEESRFEPYAESSAGAYGLMQVRSIAAAQVGERDYHDPAANIRTGTRYLKYCHDLFAGAAWRDRLALALAAYNMGPAHVQDAQQLARRYGLDPLRWDGSMAVTTLLLGAPHVCEQLPNGCALGRQVVRYVERVLARFATYRRARPAVPPGIVPVTAAVESGSGRAPRRSEG